MPEQDADASEVHETEEVLGMALVASNESPVVLKPREKTLNIAPLQKARIDQSLTKVSASGGPHRTPRSPIMHVGARRKK